MRLRSLIYLCFLFSASLFITACGGDDEDTNPGVEIFELNMTRLQDLGTDYKYEGWLMVDGSPVSTGVFSADENGNISQDSFETTKENWNAATAFVLTIEPSVDNDPAPSAVKIMAGDFNNGVAMLTVDHPAALGNNFETAMGDYILATPTDGTVDNETSGIWWLDPAAVPSPGSGLSLPTLPESWTYEGWVVIEGIPVSTGKFTSPDMSDDSAIYSGNQSSPSFPGEDLLTNAPAGLSFPIDLQGRYAVISIEPVPDNSALPFSMKPLQSSIPQSVIPSTSYNMENKAAETNPEGMMFQR